MNWTKNRLWLVALLFLSTTTAFSQKASNLIYVDKQGVMRYTKGKGEASFFGVNYTTPFAHAYRIQKSLGIDLEQAVRNDVYHFARLGLQAFRVHVWDTEISDTAGNLLENEHLRLFDFLLAELKKRNIKTIITPIAFWGNGYPERDEETPGFSRYYGRGKLTTDDAAIRAQENYLRQFFRHVNPYTGLTYEQDKDVIAVEINNEPAHSDPKSGVTSYINRLAKAIRATGWSKPVFYNIAQGPYFSDAVAAANVDGFSFQWYPSGLVGNQTIKGNTLMHVDQYRIPFHDTVPASRNRALMVYEFDAADIMGSYMYPFIAKAFRGAGFQWATQFAYDPLGMGHINTEYQTHYLNLAYTPKKAISMMIAAEVFNRIPRGKTYGTYPADSLFDVFRVSYDQDLSEMNAEGKFYYSNSTNTNPKDLSKLKHIAGTGNSPVVKYKGSGAYFLDKLENGLWRLEIMPDAVPVRDPFERTSPKKIVTAIEWNQHPIEINIPDLGSEYSIDAISNNLARNPSPVNKSSIAPGVYILKKSGVVADLSKYSKIGNIGLDEFVAPAATKPGLTVRHTSNPFVTAGESFEIKAIIAGAPNVKATVLIQGRGFGRNNMIPMIANGHDYTALVPAEAVNEGRLQYRIQIQSGDDYVLYPGAIEGHPFAWDNYQSEFYKVDVRKAGKAINLFDANIHESLPVTPNWRQGFQSGFVAGDITGKQVFQLSITKVAHQEVTGFQHYVGDMMKQVPASEKAAHIVVRVRQQSTEAADIKIALVNKWGTAFTGAIRPGTEWQEIRIPVSSLQADASLLLPRPYPGFQPLFFRSSENNPELKLQDIEKVQLFTAQGQQKLVNKDVLLQIDWIRLEF